MYSSVSPQNYGEKHGVYTVSSVSPQNYGEKHAYIQCLVCLHKTMGRNMRIFSV